MRPERATAGQPRGRPRDPAIDRALFAAVLELLAQGGYACATMEAVAERAGVQRPAIYRRFATRPALIAAAVQAALADANPAAPETDDPARDLGMILRNLISALTTTPLGAAIGALVSYLEHDSELRAAALALQRERGTLLLHALGRMRDAGTLRPGLDVATAVDVLLGTIYFRLLFSDHKPAPELARRLVALVSAGA
jgi:AcrR family transcriptional regulator